MTEEENIKEKETISDALKLCGYTQWTITPVKEKMAKKEERSKDSMGDEEEKDQYLHVTSHHSRNVLVHLKDKAEPRKGVYKIKCQGCDGCYVGVTKRKMAVKVK